MKNKNKFITKYECCILLLYTYVYLQMHVNVSTYSYLDESKGYIIHRKHGWTTTTIIELNMLVGWLIVCSSMIIHLLIIYILS